MGKEVASIVKMEEGFKNEAQEANYFRKSSLKVTQKESEHRNLSFSDIIAKGK